MGNILCVVMTIILAITASHAMERDQKEDVQQSPPLPSATAPSPQDKQLMKVKSHQNSSIYKAMCEGHDAFVLAFRFLTIYDLLRYKSVSKAGLSIVQKLPRFLINELYASHQLLKPENPKLSHLEVLQGVRHLMLRASHKDVWKTRPGVCRKILERCEAQGKEFEGTLALQVINTSLPINARQAAFNRLLASANGKNAQAQEYILMLSLWPQEAALNLTVHTDKAANDVDHPLNLWRQNCLIEPLIWLANRAAPLAPKEPFWGIKSHWAIINAGKRLPLHMLEDLLRWGLEQFNRGVTTSTPDVNVKLSFYTNAILACTIYCESAGENANAYVHLRMGMALNNLGNVTPDVETRRQRYRDAIASYTSYFQRIKKQKDPEMYLNRGHAYNNLGEITTEVETTKAQHYTVALASYTSHLQRIEKQEKQADPDVHLHIGNAYYNLCGAVGKLEDKQKSLQSAIESYKTYQNLKGAAAEPMISKKIENAQKTFKALGVK